MMNPTLEEKKNFISWFIQNYQLKRERVSLDTQLSAQS